MKRVFLYLLLSLSFFHSLSYSESPTQMENSVINTPNGTFTPWEEGVKKEEEGDSHFFQEFLSMLFSLGIILGAIFFLMWVLRRMTNVRMEQVNLTSSIKVLERRALSPKTTIYILNVSGKAITIADSHNGVTLLSQTVEDTISKQ
jgi:flagellar biogenesis protein FliO